MPDGIATQSIVVRPLTGHTGAELAQVDLTKPLSDGDIATIRAALLRWKVVFFKHQNIDHAAQIEFARRFGEVTYAHPHEDDPIEGYPEILPIDRRRYESRFGPRYTYDSRWHTDVTPAVNPPAASILRAVDVPVQGGDTTWTNLVAAYAGLSEPLQRLVDGLQAEHRFGLHQHHASKYLERISQTPLVAVHPVVRVHPETGERALFVSPGFTSHIIGLSRRESDRILELLFEQITRPAYTVRFRWEPGHIAFWDNRATAHLGPQDLDHLDVERVLYRVTLTGDVPVGVDGFRSQAIAGERFGTEPLPRVRAGSEAQPALA